eukprot:3350375-Prymnesium_polylepis.1
MLGWSSAGVSAGLSLPVCSLSVSRSIRSAVLRQTSSHGLPSSLFVGGEPAAGPNSLLRHDGDLPACAAVLLARVLGVVAPRHEVSAGGLRRCRQLLLRLDRVDVLHVDQEQDPTR